jgi:hypothetical protein
MSSLDMTALLDAIDGVTEKYTPNKINEVTPVTPETTSGVTKIYHNNQRGYTCYTGYTTKIQKYEPDSGKTDGSLWLQAKSPNQLGVKEINADELQIIRVWLNSIGETDAQIINEVLESCEQHPNTLEYFLRLTKRLPIISANDLRDYFHERAAIMEYDGGMNRVQAEQIALAETTAWAQQQGVTIPNDLHDHA